MLRFVFGLTDYELGIANFSHFCRYYQRWGSSVTEQVLNLTSEEKLQLNLLLEENYQEENRVYRYNYFYDNCSTRPRDIIERCIDGKVVYEQRQDYSPSFRELTHEKTYRHRWATFGNDMRDLSTQFFHSTAADAATTAAEAGVAKLVIGHFSSRYPDVNVLLNEARQIFPETYLAEEGMIFDVPVKKLER